MAEKKTPAQQLEIAAQWLAEAAESVSDKSIQSNLRRVSRECKAMAVTP
jgi:ribosomal protein S7